MTESTCTYLYFYENSNAKSQEIYKKIIGNGLFIQIKLVNVDQYKSHLPGFIKEIPLLLLYESETEFTCINDISKINDIINNLFEKNKDVELKSNEIDNIDLENSCLYSDNGLISIDDSSNDVLKIKIEDSDFTELTNSSDVDKLMTRRKMELD